MLLAISRGLSLCLGLDVTVGHRRTPSHVSPLSRCDVSGRVSWELDIGEFLQCLSRPVSSVDRRGDEESPEFRPSSLRPFSLPPLLFWRALEPLCVDRNEGVP